MLKSQGYKGYDLFDRLAFDAVAECRYDMSIIRAVRVI